MCGLATWIFDILTETDSLPVISSGNIDAKTSLSSLCSFIPMLIYEFCTAVQDEALRVDT